MSVLIIDNFTTSNHGYVVKEAIEDIYTGNILVYDVGKNVLSYADVYSIFNDVYSKLDSQYSDVDVINFSFGGGHSSDPFYLLRHFKPLYELYKSFFAKGVDIFLPAGNLSDKHTVSKIATGPFTHCVSAVEGMYNPELDDYDVSLASYSQYSSNITTEIASGYEAGHHGTSFSSPHMASVFALMKELYGLSTEEIMYHYIATADFFDNVFLKLDIDEIKNVSEQSLDDRMFIFDLYALVCGRFPDESGYEFWLTHLHTADLEHIVSDFIRSAESFSDTGKNAVPLQYKILALYHFFTDDIPSHDVFFNLLDFADNSHTFSEVVNYFLNAYGGDRLLSFADDICRLNTVVELLGDHFLSSDFDPEQEFVVAC